MNRDNGQGETADPSGPEAEATAEDPRLVRALEEYRVALEAGREPDRTAFLALHPEIGPVLAECLDGLKFIHKAAPAISGPTDGSLLENPSDALDFPVDTALGDFRILREIGHGGMGIVYEAEQVSLGRRVALKVLPFAAALHPKQLQRFKNEAHAAAHLRHANIVTVYAVGCERGRHYYAMEYIEGQTLAAIIRELRQLAGLEGIGQPAADSAAAQLASELASGRLTPAGGGPPPGPSAGPQLSGPRTDIAVAETTTQPVAAISTEHSTKSPAFFRTVASLGVQAANALQHAHDQGVVHRDIKPANLLIDGRGNLWITDFGLARMQCDAALTVTGDLLGTLRYMSPEQALARRELLDHRTDIYSLAVTLYELLTLQPAFTGRDRQEVLRQIAFEEPRPPRRLNKAIPADLETIVSKAIEKDPPDRYATAQELADDLHRFLEDKPIRARRPALVQRARKWARRHQPLMAAAALLLVMAVIALAAGTLLIWREQARTEVQRWQAEDAAERARQMAVEARQQQQIAEQLLSRSQLDRGVRLLEEGNCLGLFDLVQARITAEHIPGARDAVPFLWAGWHQDYAGQLVHVVGHDGPVVAVAFSPDGERLATASEDSTARVWASATGLPAGPPLRHRAGVLAVAFSPDGKLLATGSRDGNAQLWEPATGAPHGPPLHYGHGPVNSVTFSPDGKLLVIAAVGQGPHGEWVMTAPGIVQFWDPATGKPHGPPIERRQEIEALAVSTDGKLLATSPGGRTVPVVDLWDLSTGKPHGQPLRHPTTVTLLAFSPDGKLLGTLRSGNARLWNTATGVPHGPPMEFKRWGLDLKFSPDGKLLATALMSWTVQLWETATGALHGEPLRHEGPVKTVAFSRDGKLLASGSFDMTARLWDAATREPLCPALRHQGTVHAVVFSPDGKLLATASQDGTARLWTTSSQVRGKLLRHQQIVNAVAFSPDSKLLATAANRGVARVWQVASGQLLGQPLRHRNDVTAVAFSPDGKLLASGSDDGIIQLWDPATGQAQGPALRQPPGDQALAFSPDGRLLVTGSQNGQLQLWNPATGQLQGKPFGKQDGLKTLAFSPDGKLVATGSFAVVWLWDSATGEPRGQPLKPPGHSLRRGGTVRGVAFSPDGKWLAVASEDGITQLWDVSTAQPYGPPLRHPAAVWGVAFSRDGRLLATGVADNTVRVWDLSTGAPRHSFRLRHGRADQGPVRVAFSPDGELLASGSDDGTARLWRLPKVPSSLREMQLRTWVALGARQSANGEVETIPWQEWRKLREELHGLEKQRQTAANEPPAVDVFEGRGPAGR